MSLRLDDCKQHFPFHNCQKILNRDCVLASTVDQSTGNKKVKINVKLLSSRRLLIAMSIAALVIAVFNSNGLVRQANDLSDNVLGQVVIDLTESWHKKMHEKGLTFLPEHIAPLMVAAKEAQWQDVGGQVSATIELLSSMAGRHEKSARHMDPLKSSGSL